MIPIVIPFVIAFLGLASLMAIRTRLHHRDVQMLEADLRKKHDELLKAKSVGDRLLTANDEMTRDGLTTQKVVEAIQQDPTLVTPALVLEAFKATPEALKQVIHASLSDDPDLFAEIIDVDRLLEEHGVTHDWHKVGDRQIKVPKDKGKGFSHYALITDMCQRCRMEHQYFRDGGHPSIDDREGFYLGGKRIEIEGNQAPTCLAVFDGLFGSAKDVKGA